jgi:hypothetical protein
VSRKNVGEVFDLRPALLTKFQTPVTFFLVRNFSLSRCRGKLRVREGIEPVEKVWKVVEGDLDVSRAPSRDE